MAEGSAETALDPARLDSLVRRARRDLAPRSPLLAQRRGERDLPRALAAWLLLSAAG